MSDDIRPNDVVVCVDARPNPIASSGKIFPVEGVYYRVIGIADPMGCAHCNTAASPGVFLRELPTYNQWGWCEHRFRKLHPAEPCFTEAMQRLIEPAPAKQDIVAELRALNFGGW